MQRKRMLICGIAMPCAGTEKALLSFLHTVDRAEWDVTLLLAETNGELLTQIPQDIRLLGPMKFGDMFLLRASSAPQALCSLLLQHPTAIATLLPFTIRCLLQPHKRSMLATRMWIRLMHRFCPSFSEEFGRQVGDAPFDIVLSFWGDRTMFYACDKVRANRHLTWLHFDYCHPQREDALFFSYFSRCQRVICVSEDCTRLLKTHFPGLSDRIITFENRISPARIRMLAAEPCPLPRSAEGQITVLTVARICPQKGLDRIPHALALLKKRGLSVRWVILGDGIEKEKAALSARARQLGVSDRLILCGTIVNPYPYFAACDIFALPSRFEGKPITVEEAKILGCPIAVCDYLAARRQLDNGRLGIIVPQDDGTGMAGAIQALAESHPLRMQYRQACLESVADMPGQGMRETESLLSGML